MPDEAAESENGDDKQIDVSRCGYRAGGDYNLFGHYTLGGHLDYEDYACALHNN